MNRRLFLTSGLAAALAACSARAAAQPITVYKTPWCGCCGGWVAIMARSGFQPDVVEVEDLAPVWRRHGVPDRLSSCHVAQVNGYVIVGHVPPTDVSRLLRERPNALGLVVPGMPIGSPGMEVPSGEREAYETLLLGTGGRTELFAVHPRRVVAG